MLRTRLALFAAFTTVALAALAVARPPQVQLMRDPLEGKWDVTVTPDDDARSSGAREFQDVFTFKNSSFDSKEMVKHGFEKVMYDSDTRPAGVGGFSAAAISTKDEGKAKWSGFVTADQLTGDFTWTKKDGTPWHYSFKGSKEE